MQSPEEIARENIDPLLNECGWRIQKRSEINLSGGRQTEGLLNRKHQCYRDKSREERGNALRVFSDACMRITTLLDPNQDAGVDFSKEYVEAIKMKDESDE